MQNEALARQLRGLGNRLRRARRLDQAVAAFEAALALDPESAATHNDLGVAHHRAGRMDAAMAAYRRAAELDPDFAKAHSNIGSVHLERNETAAAIAAYERALEGGRMHPAIRTNLAFAQLLGGDLRPGWRNYEHRWAAGARGVRKSFPREPWRGDRPLTGRSIAICSEQGFGDMIQFARYVPLVARLGARVRLQAERPLERLFRASFPQVEAVCPADGGLPACDEYCTAPSLALAFDTDLSTVPSAVPYLRPPAAWAVDDPLLAGSPGVPRVGLVWSGDPRHHNDHNRSLPFELLRPLVASVPYRFVSLQKEVRASDAPALAGEAKVADASARLTDFGETAGLVDRLDLVIAVDTAVAHLAGALAKPVWLLLPYAPDWRWLLGRNDSPWYPTMRLFRQPRPGDWTAVLASVRDALAERFFSPPGGA